MNLTKWGVIAVALLTYLMPSDVKAQDKVEVSLGADLVSGYVWRGQDLGGVSLQPSISISKGGLSLTGWGSVGLEKTDTREFDLTLGYSTGGPYSSATTLHISRPVALATASRMACETP